MKFLKFGEFIIKAKAFIVNKKQQVGSQESPLAADHVTSSFA